MKSLKRTAAVLISACTALTCLSSCGENTAKAMTIDGYEVRSGIYLYYVTSAYNDAIKLLGDKGEDFTECTSTKDYKKILKNIDIDNVSASEWIQNKAVQYCQTFVAIERDFEEKGLKFSGEQLASIESSVASSKTYFGTFFEENGIGEQTVHDIIASSYKQNMLWDAYYGEGGSVGIEDSQLYDYYKDNHLRVKYITMPLKDGEGNLLKADGKAEIEAMANDFLARLAKKSGSEAELMAEFDYLIDENATYQTSISQAAITTTDDEGNTVTTETTAKVTTTEAAQTEDTTDGTGEAETAEGTTTAPAETTTAAEETTGTTTTTTTAATGDTTDNTDTATETTTTTTTTYKSIGYDTSNERILTVSTAATTDPNASAETTTTAPSYTPCEKVYNWFIDEKTEYNQPELIKDDECYYVAVKLNIEDRMTDDDLWIDSAKETVRTTLFNEEFTNMLDEKGAKLEVTRNDKAFKRYDVLDLDVVAYQTAVMQSYYSQYNYNYGS